MVQGRHITDRRGGFTTLELVNTALIGMILIAVAAAGYRLYQRDMPVRYAAQRLSRAMTTARSFAVANNSIYAVRIDPTYQNFWIDETDDLGTVVVPKVVAPESLGDKASLVAVAYGLTPLSLGTALIPVKFYPDGSSDDARLTLRLGDGTAGTYYAVRVYGPTGQARVLSDVGVPTSATALNTALAAPSPVPSTTKVQAVRPAVREGRR